MWALETTLHDMEAQNESHTKICEQNMAQMLMLYDIENLHVDF